jgi:hypothetical protein
MAISSSAALYEHTPAKHYERVVSRRLGIRIEGAARHKSSPQPVQNAIMGIIVVSSDYDDTLTTVKLTPIAGVTLRGEDAWAHTVTINRPTLTV